MRALHHLLASISIGILLVSIDALHLVDSILLLKVLSAKDNYKVGKNSNASASKAICSFDHFKLILLSLFGENICYLSEEQLDKILRMAYIQITASAEPVIESRKSKDGAVV